MEVIFQDSIGFIYDVCRVIICKSNKRESWINAFLCDGSEEEDMLYIDNLLKKFQGIEISNKLLGYKKSQTQDAILEDLYGRYLQEKTDQANIEEFVKYVTEYDVLKKEIAKYFLNVDSVENNAINEAIYVSQYSLDLKAELYDFNLFTERYIENIKKEFENIINVMKLIYREVSNTINGIVKPRFQIDNFLKNMKEYLQNDTWESGINRYIVTFSFFNRYLVIRQVSNYSNAVMILGVEYEHFFYEKQKKQIDLVSFGNALGDKIRMKMISLLCEDGELTLTDFSNKLNIVNAVALYHLDILKEAKLILRRNEGRRVLYWLNGSQFNKAIEEISNIVGRCK